MSVAIWFVWGVSRRESTGRSAERDFSLGSQGWFVGSDMKPKGIPFKKIRGP